MKANALTFFALAVMTPATFLACAGGAETGMGGEGGTGGTGGSGGGAVTTTTGTTTTTNTTSTTTGTTTTTTTTTGGGCVSQCTSDADCQNSCPVVSTGTNCCDTSIGICYVGTAATCPTGGTGGTGGTSSY